ncbi:MAG TPA: C40 family peptidase [Pyrinomonadaceae bacterium]|jgi:cell wall-associated NlpC family hydrolase|nr:C40 family peptidase [Pyrinomonadaceae bacterium]
MIFRNRLCISLCLSVLFASFAININAQTRSRIVPTRESQPVNTQVSTDKLKRTILSSPTTQRPILTNQINVAQNKPLVKNIVDSKPTYSTPTNANNSILNSRLVYTPNLNQRLMSSIQSKIGIPYLYGAEGPNRYDCSSFVWKVFQEAGISFTRTSARTFWNDFEPVYGDDRFKFGTLVFFNKLGHVGIVADENGFYQASSSKGITYSPFKGYWEKRIVGYRRIPADYAAKR